MCRETSTTSPSVSDWPLVPGAAAARGELQLGEARVLRSARDADEVVACSRGNAIACGVSW